MTADIPAPDHAREKVIDSYFRQIEEAKRTFARLPAKLRREFNKEAEAFFNDPHRYD